MSAVRPTIASGRAGPGLSHVPSGRRWRGPVCLALPRPPGSVILNRWALATPIEGRSRMEIVPRDDPRVVALSAALGPYAWTKLTPEMLARRVVGVLDRYWLLGELPGSRPEAWMDDLEPA